MKKIRVKCANCHTIYDIGISVVWGDPQNPPGRCPKCGSNAYDKIKEENREYK